MCARNKGTDTERGQRNKQNPDYRSPRDQRQPQQIQTSSKIPLDFKSQNM